MHCPLPIDFVQDCIVLIGSRIEIMNIPSMSDISAAIVLTPNRPNQPLNIGQFEAISSVVFLETSGTRTGRKLSRGFRNGNPNVIISLDLKKENYDHSTITGCGTAN
jgi:hypothetical protein